MSTDDEKKIETIKVESDNNSTPDEDFFAPVDNRVKIRMVEKFSLNKQDEETDE